MKHHVYKIFVNYEKEEAWLNKMAAQGFALENFVLGRYTFKRSQPGEYIYRLELLANRIRSPESVAYLEFMEDAGVEMVSSYGPWVYFRKKSVDGPFELFSDKTSKLAHYRRIIYMLAPIALLNLLFSMRLFHGNHQHYFNLGAFIILAIPISIYYKRLAKLKKESAIRE